MENPSYAPSPVRSLRAISEGIEQKQLQFRNTLYAHVGIRAGKEGYDSSNTATLNFAKGIVDALIEKISVAISLGEIQMDQILDAFKHIDWTKAGQEIWKSLTNIPRNAYEFGKLALMMLLQSLGAVAIIDKILKVIEKVSIIRGATVLANRTEKLREFSSLGVQKMKDRLRDYLASHPNPKIQNISRAMQTIIQFQRDKIHPSAPEYLAIATALSSLSMVVIQKLDQCEACTLVGDKDGEERIIRLLAQEVDKVAKYHHIALV